jgi:hypothetical protein
VLGGRAPTLADLPSLDYVNQVIAESMRCYPAFWAMTREAIADGEIGGYPFCQRDIRGSSRVAYTARSLVLTMILKGCRLSEVEVAERNRTMQKVDRLRSQGSEQPDEGSGPGRRP